jgi:hypothetical protein
LWLWLNRRIQNRVYEDEEEWFREIFSGSKKEDVPGTSTISWCSGWAGPPLFSQMRGNLIHSVSEL